MYRTHYLTVSLIVSAGLHLITSSAHGMFETISVVCHYPEDRKVLKIAPTMPIKDLYELLWQDVPADKKASTSICYYIQSSDLYYCLEHAAFNNQSVESLNLFSQTHVFYLVYLNQAETKELIQLINTSPLRLSANQLETLWKHKPGKQHLEAFVENLPESLNEILPFQQRLYAFARTHGLAELSDKTEEDSFKTFLKKQLQQGLPQPGLGYAKIAGGIVAMSALIFFIYLVYKNSSQKISVQKEDKEDQDTQHTQHHYTINTRIAS